MRSLMFAWRPMLPPIPLSTNEHNRRERPLKRFFQESSDINVTFEGVQKRTVEAFSEESSSIFLALGRLSSFVLVRRFLPAKKLEHC